MASKNFTLVPKKSSTNSLRDAKPSVGATTDRTPGPTIEAIEGDRIRLLVTNKLPEHTQRALARHPAAERHGWRRRIVTAGYSASETYAYEFHAAPARHALCITRTPMR